MYCRNCGKEIDDKAIICPNCGVQQCNIVKDDALNIKDTGSIGWGVLGFCIPIVGLVLYLVWQDTSPKNSKMAGKGALISAILAGVLFVAYMLFIVFMFSMIFSIG